MASESALAPAPISESDDGRSFTKASSSWRTLSPWGQSRDISGQGGWQPKHPTGWLHPLFAELDLARKGMEDCGVNLHPPSSSHR